LKLQRWFAETYRRHERYIPEMSQPLYKAQKVNNPVSVGRDSLVGKATAMGWTVLWSNPGWGRDFPNLSIPPLGPSQLSAPRVAHFFPRGKAAGVWL